MAITENIYEALDLKTLQLPANPKVLAIDVQEFTDRDGDEMLRVLVTIDEDTDIENWTGEAIGQFKRAIRDSLRMHGVDLFAIVEVAKPSELQEN